MVGWKYFTNPNIKEKTNYKNAKRERDTEFLEMKMKYV